MATTTISAGTSTSGLSIDNGNDGTFKIKTGATAGAQVDAVTFAADGTPTFLKAGLTSGTAVASTSGTAIDFTGIPSWVRRITVALRAVSTNGTSSVMIRVGAGSIESTGYASSAGYVGTLSASITSTTGYLITNGASLGDADSGTAVLTLLGSNTWVLSSVISPTASNFMYVGAGDKVLSGTLDRIRLTTSNGTDTFDAGSVNILYE
jgi:hypothetical protein